MAVYRTYYAEPHSIYTSIYVLHLYLYIYIYRYVYAVVSKFCRFILCFPLFCLSAESETEKNVHSVENKMQILRSYSYVYIYACWVDSNVVNRKKYSLNRIFHCLFFCVRHMNEVQYTILYLHINIYDKPINLLHIFLFIPVYQEPE